MKHAMSLSILAGLAAARLGAQEPPLQLGEVVQQVLATHPAARAGDALAGSARAGVRQARSSWLPSASVDASATRFGDPMVVAPLHGFDLTRPPSFDQSLWQAGLSLSWPLFDPARSDRIGRARAEVSGAEAGREQVLESLIARSVSAFLEVRTARELVTFHEARLEALRREREREATLVREGRAARLAVIRAEAALASAQAERLTAVARRDAAERALERLLAAPPGSVTGRDLGAVSLAPVDTTPGRPSLIAAAEAQNPELARRAARVAAARAARAEAQASWYPKLNLVGRLIQYGSGQGAEATEWQGGVALSYPLYTGGARSAGVERAGAELAAAEADADAARRDLGDAVDRALAAFVAARGRVEALTAAATQAQEVARIERLALDQGAGVQTDYLIAEADLLQARAGLGEAGAALVNARVELARLTGALTLEWLGVHLESAS